MKDLHGCDCETTMALLANDCEAIVAAVQSHKSHNCPNFITALQIVISKFTATEENASVV